MELSATFKNVQSDKATVSLGNRDINWGFRNTFEDYLRTLPEKDVILIKEQQNVLEMDTVLTYIKNLVASGVSEPFTYLEIGSYAGESLFFISQVLPKNSHIILVDYGDNPIARGLLNKVIEWVKESFGHKIDLLTKDSTDNSTLSLVKVYLRPKVHVDLCFIDANHLFNYVLKDLQNYGPISNITLFHDISMRVERKRDEPMVQHLWSVIKTVLPQKPLNVSDVIWDEIEDNKSNMKPRGFGILDTAWVFSR